MTEKKFTHRRIFQVGKAITSSVQKEVSRLIGFIIFCCFIIALSLAAIGVRIYTMLA